VAPLPCFIGDLEPGLVRVLPPVTEMASVLWLLTHPDLRRTARVRAVLDLLARRLARQRGLLEGSG
jgi:DNA-binding transcriptional LysR family regulator